ncbi:DUF3313 domain-containing protein [Nitrospirillum sp. BR 11164]|uniref:DUF3313 domain-containing protein n=1 Tax=Nitrospirillum sp. BR 11164 TaxID=3104324 RepID=UPI002AFFDB75|nr:DUF3313 domain-containing protein [Nitrospirillum sp. BR 11164]MEA1652645.1 DUF3313 domain-containing protein [Nitrospirillum sp. BR 11164]
MSDLIRRLLLPLAACALLAGCGGIEPAPYRDIASASYLRPNPSDDTGRVPYRYAAAADWRAYSKVIIDPVAIYYGADGQFGDMEEKDKVELADYMQAEFRERLATRFLIVGTPAPGTLRVHLTLTGATTTPAVIGPFSHFDLAGGLYNGVQAIRGRQGMISGSVVYAVEVHDAASGKLLSAYITKQYPGAMNVGASFGSLGAAKTGIDKGADALVAQLSPDT